MLARFDRYVLGQLMVVFGFFSLVIVLIYWVNRAVSLFDRLIGDGQSVAVFIEFSLLVIPFLMFIVLPLAAFAATVQVANRLSNESEIVVLRATGISAFRLIRPALVLGTLVCILMLILSNLLVPVSRTQLAYREADLAEDVTARLLDEGKFMHPTANVTIFIGKVGANAVLERVLISDRRTPDREVVYTAEQALLVRADDGPRLIMVEGLAQEMSGSRTLSLLKYRDFAFDLDDLVPETSRVIRDLRAYPTRLLLVADPRIQELTGFTPAQMLHEAHTRFSKALAAIPIAGIGFAALLMGGFSRFGFWQQVATGVLALLALQLINNAAENAALASASAWPVLYAPVLVGFAILGGMLWLAEQPSIGILLRRLRRAAPTETAP